MKLLTKEILNRIPKLYGQEKVPDPIVHVKFFHPCSNWTFYATEYSPEERTFFGWNPMDGELGYLSQDEMEKVVVRGCKVERDMYFRPQPLSEVKALENR